MEPKTSRKIVSKGAYAKQLAVRSILLLLGVTEGILVWRTVTNLLRLWLTRPEGIANSIGPIMLCVVILLFTTFGLGMLMIVKTVGKINLGVPLTRANTADLPAPDSLVRASTEPEQAQQAVLLRAAAKEQERQAEELVRAVAGQK